MARKGGYPSDLQDAEWAKLAPLLERSERRGRVRRVEMRSVVNGLLYWVRTGCQWRMIPHEFEHWSVIRYYFDTWRKDGTWERIKTLLRREARLHQQRESEPSAAVIDSQSAKTSEAGGMRGYDGGKKIKGRKRHILVDTLGHVLHAYVHPADWTDSEGGAALLHQALPSLPRLVHLWADSAYLECRDWLRWRTGAQINLEIVTNPAPDAFVVAPRRWVVERTLAWLGRWRRFSKDFEHLPSATTFLIYFVSARRLLNLLAFS